jgi:TPR repeat protein
MKREKKQPPLEKTCAFCRRPAHKNCAQLLRRYEARIAKDDTHAMLNLAYMFRDGCNCLRKDDAKASELLDRAAQLGSAEAIAELGLWVANGWLDSIPDRTKAKFFFEDAAKKGDVPSRYNLAKLWADEDNYDLAIKHWNLAAAAGLDESMNSLWKCFSKDKLSKVDLEKALRAHKASSDDMNSEERERWDAWKKAKAGNDELLRLIYASYYLGHINAKDVKAALKLHRAGDWRALTTLLASKDSELFYRYE